MLTLALLALVPADIEALDSKEFSKEAQARAVVATVRVGNAAAGSTGSGVLLKRQGPFVYVLTANHVVAGAKRVEVSTFTADSYPRAAAVYPKAEVIAQSAEADLAVLRLTTRDEMPGSVAVGPPRDAPAGKAFVALSVGCGDGGAPACALEDVRGTRRVRKPGAEAAVTCWETARAPARGRSGGPLLDRDGRLIGLDSGASDGKGYYTHLEEIQTFLRHNGLKSLCEEKDRK
ncbi:MAG TPA: serine protease [Gemmataceae bacterium]|nr:serine protease [Gemmataceae bacterium]